MQIEHGECLYFHCPTKTERLVPTVANQVTICTSEQFFLTASVQAQFTSDNRTFRILPFVRTAFLCPPCSSNVVIPVCTKIRRSVQDVSCALLACNVFKYTLAMTGFPYSSVEYNYQNAFRNLVFDVNRSNCLSVHFGNSIFAWEWKNCKVF